MNQEFPDPRTFPDRYFHGTRILLIGTVWVSAGLFGLYSIAIYASALAGTYWNDWNGGLIQRYGAISHLPSSGIGIHFAAGGILFLLGTIQFIRPLRRSAPSIHRVIGCIYVLASIVTASAGLVFIFSRGSIGGFTMDAGFTLYAVLILLAAIQTMRHAIAGHFSLHGAWGMRLYALILGTWLYRIYYSINIGAFGGWGHTPTFTGPFDKIMVFFFFLPNLFVVELLLRRNPKQSVGARLGIATFFALICGFLWVATFYITRYRWGPAVLRVFE